MGGSNCKSFSPKHSEKVKTSEPTGSGSSFSCKPEQEPEKSAGKVEGEYIEDVVCTEDDIKDNEMKLLPLGGIYGGKILLVKQHGELHALGYKCTHYGALLHTGALGEGRVRCPWHGACFNIKTGDIEDYPGLDSLPCYKVTVVGGKVKVKAKRSDLETNKRTKTMWASKKEISSVAVIVGGGPAGATCAETLRQDGFQGRIIMVCKESVLPYDRVKVSKALDFDVEKATLRSKKFYEENDIEVKLGEEAVQLNTEKQIVTLESCQELEYNYLFLATGSSPKKPNLPGINLKNIFVLRNYTDSEAISKELATKKHVVILGSSFIGMEVAAYCKSKCAVVTVIGRDVPFKPVFGEQIGQRIKKEFEDKGIKFHLPSGVKRFIPNLKDEETVARVQLLNGELVQADIVIIGIGSTFNTDWLKNSGLNLCSDGSILVDKYLMTKIKNVYAGGDIARAPVFCADDAEHPIGHFPLAHYHGKIAATNIARSEECMQKIPLRAVPYFWTTLFGKSYRYAGHGKYTNIQIFGSLENLKYFAYYFEEDKVIAMSSCGADPIVSDYANYIYEGNTLTTQDLKENPTGWMRNKPKDFEDFLPSEEPQL